MSIQILRAVYGGEDVTQIVKLLVQSGPFKVSNEHFGDPHFGVRKRLECDFQNETGEKLHVVFYEGEVAEFSSLKNTDRLAIYYTDNTKPKLLEKTLPLIVEATNKHNVQLLVSAFRPINFNVRTLLSLWAERGYPTLTTQIIQLLTYAKKIGNYKYVSFLEHDVLYAPEYFAYPDFDKMVLHNTNYIGVCATGFQKFSATFPPLSQLTMNFDFALEFYENQLRARFRQEEPIWIEPIEEDRRDFAALQPNVHINHSSFTDHKNYFKGSNQNAEYWGDFKNCWIAE